VAGDSLSDTLVKLYYFEPLRDFAACHCTTELDVYFDDIQLAVRGSRAVVKRDLKAAAEDLKEVIEVDLGATLAADKATITSDSKSLCDELREELGAVAGAPTEVAQFLGVDSLLGRRRRVLKSGSKFKKRLKHVGRRRERLRRLAAGCKAGAGKIFTAGLLPAAVYGVDVLGITSTELARLQAVALAAMKPATRGRSKSSLFAAKGDPTWSAATAPIRRWAQEVWFSVVPKSRVAERLPTLGPIGYLFFR